MPWACRVLPGLTEAVRKPERMLTEGNRVLSRLDPGPSRERFAATFAVLGEDRSTPPGRGCVFTPEADEVAERRHDAPQLRGFASRLPVLITVAIKDAPAILFHAPAERHAKDARML